MSQKQQDLMRSYHDGKISRRELMRRLGRLGMGATAASFFLNQFTTSVLAAGFDWGKHKGKTIRVLLNKHPYTDAMLKNLKNFEDSTGITVKYDVFPEDVYFDKVTAALSSGSSQYDAFMTGAYQTWTYSSAGWIEDMNAFIDDSSKTSPSYNWDDVLVGVRKSCSWNGVPGDPVGTGDAKQWCIPLGYEQNNITYNADVFKKSGLKVPTNMDEMVDTAIAAKKYMGGNGYGIGVRGSRSWATIHPGFLSGYSNFGLTDLRVSNGKLSANMSNDVSRAYHEKFVKMVQQGGASDWSTHTWYQVGTDLGSGKSAMIFDADILGYFMNGEGNAMAGRLAYSPFAANPAAAAPTPNIWIWSVAMSKFSKQKDPVWYFMQWASGTEHTMFGATKMDVVDPVRQSIWDNTTFKNRLSTSYPGYVDMFNVSAPGAKIYFTPQPLFFDITTEWAAMLQNMVAKQISVDEGLDKLATSIDKQLKDSGLG